MRIREYQAPWCWITNKNTFLFGEWCRAKGVSCMGSKCLLKELIGDFNFEVEGGVYLGLVKEVRI